MLQRSAAGKWLEGKVFQILTIKDIFHETFDKMQVLLISDTTTEKSAAALDVHVGSMSDPEVYQTPWWQYECLYKQRPYQLLF